MQRQQIIGYGLALTAVFLWSQNVVLAQGFVSRILPLEFAFGRWLIALMILLPLGGKSVFKYRHYLWRHGVWLMGLALSGIVLTNTLIYMAANTIDAVTISLLNLPAPIFLMILSALFLKQKITLRQIGGIIVSVGGVLIILTNGNLMHIAEIQLRPGDLWMILNAFCFAVYSFLQTKRPAFISQLTLLTGTVLVGVLILAPMCLYFDWTHIAKLTWTDWMVLGFLGIFNSVIAYLAWNGAIDRIGTVKTGLIFYLQPVFSMLGAMIMLNAQMTWDKIVGGLIIILGIYWANRKKR